VSRVRWSREPQASASDPRRARLRLYLLSVWAHTKLPESVFRPVRASGSWSGVRSGPPAERGGDIVAAPLRGRVHSTR
jgi:hypothetical protein